MRRLLLSLAALAFLAGACGGDDGGGDSAGSSYDTVSDLNNDLTAGGIDCVLEYEGLKDADTELSRCVIDGEQATLNIWFNDDLRKAIIDASGDTVAFGDNWTIQVGSAEVAQRLADTLDGSTGEATD